MISAAESCSISPGTRTWVSKSLCPPWRTKPNLPARVVTLWGAWAEVAPDIRQPVRICNLEHTRAREVVFVQTHCLIELTYSSLPQCACFSFSGWFHRSVWKAWCSACRRFLLVHWKTSLQRWRDYTDFYTSYQECPKEDDQQIPSSQTCVLG